MDDLRGLLEGTLQNSRTDGDETAEHQSYHSQWPLQCTLKRELRRAKVNYDLPMMVEI